MDNYKLVAGKRRVVQLFLAPVFLVVLILGWQYPLLGYFIPLCMLLGIGSGLWRGRKWCDWYCPRGSFYDALLSPLSPKRRIPDIARRIPFRVAVLLLLFGIMTYNLIRRWPDAAAIGVAFVMLVSATTALGIVLAFIWHPRTWCMLCPVGTLINITGGRRRPVTIDSGLCVECKLCAKVCPVQIRPYSFKSSGIQVVADRDCLRCGLCAAACPKKALRVS